MNKIWAIAVGAAVGVATMAGVAVAQISPGYDRGPDSGEDRGGDWGPDRQGEMGWQHHHRSMMDGSHFHFRKGDADVDIHCSGEESLQACVNAATTLLDKIGNAPGQTAKPPGQ